MTSEQRSGSSAYNVSYQYDPAGNRLVKSDSGQVSRYNYNAANELLVLTPPSGSATTFTWDGNGNTLVQIVGSARTTYTWDGENRLLGVLFSNGQRETYSYAADGLRRKKVDISGLQYLYVWDEENLLLWTDQNLNFQNQYTQYPGQWGGMVSERHTGSSFFYGFDLSANTRFMAQISGSITDHYLYRAFGDGEVVSGSNFNPYQYGGQYGYFQEAIPVEGSLRYYVRARHLRADLGRWMSRDPLGLYGEDRNSQPPLPSGILSPDPAGSAGGDWNLYRYVRNRPAVVADPSGLRPAWTCPDCLWVRAHPGCYGCMTAIRDTYNPTWQHNCNHRMMHCFLCCVLTKRGGSGCALHAQNCQSCVEPGGLGTPAARMTYCRTGIRLSGSASSASACASLCAARYAMLHTTTHKPYTAKDCVGCFCNTRPKDTPKNYHCGWHYCCDAPGFAKAMPACNYTPPKQGPRFPGHGTPPPAGPGG